MNTNYDITYTIHNKNGLIKNTFTAYQGTVINKLLCSSFNNLENIELPFYSDVLGITIISINYNRDDLSE